MAWFQFDMSNDPNFPAPRECHTMTVVGDKLLLLGGNDGTKRFVNVSMFDTKTMLWSELHTTGDSIQRTAHSAALVDGKYLYVFGGWSGAKELDELRVLDLETNVWTKPDTVGVTPQTRHFHTSFFLGRHLYVFGGYNGMEWINDISALNVDTMEWEQVRFEGEGPSSRASAVCVVISDTTVLFHGGYDGNSFLSDMWYLHVDRVSTGLRYSWELIGCQKSAPASSCWPSARSGHAAEIFGDYMLIVGGRHDEGRSNDIVAFHILDRQWKSVPVAGVPFRARKTHTVSRVGNKLWLFGGHDGTVWQGDLSVIDLSSFIEAQVVSDGFLYGPQSINAAPKGVKSDHVASKIAAAAASSTIHVSPSTMLSDFESLLNPLQQDTYFSSLVGDNLESSLSKYRQFQSLLTSSIPTIDAVHTRKSLKGEGTVIARNCLSRPFAFESPPPLLDAANPLPAFDFEGVPVKTENPCCPVGAIDMGKLCDLSDFSSYCSLIQKLFDTVCGFSMVDLPESYGNSPQFRSIVKESDVMFDQSLKDSLSCLDEYQRIEASSESFVESSAPFGAVTSKNNQILASNSPMNPSISCPGEPPVISIANHSPSVFTSQISVHDNTEPPKSGSPITISASIPVEDIINVKNAFNRYALSVVGGTAGGSLASDAMTEAIEGHTGSINDSLSLSVSPYSSQSLINSQTNNTYNSASSSSSHMKSPLSSSSNFERKRGKSTSFDGKSPIFDVPVTSKNIRGNVQLVPCPYPNPTFADILVLVGGPELSFQVGESGCSGLNNRISVNFLDSLFHSSTQSTSPVDVNNLAVPFLLHRSILASRSEFFRTLFQSALPEHSLFKSPSLGAGNGSKGFKWMSDRIVHFSSLRSDVFSIITRFMYTDQLPAETDLAPLCLEVAVTSEFLGLPRLSQLCQRYLSSHLTNESCTRALRISDACGLQGLKSAAIQLAATDFSSISASIEFIALPEHIMKEVMMARHIVVKRSRDSDEMNETENSDIRTSAVHFSNFNSDLKSDFLRNSSQFNFSASHEFDDLLVSKGSVLSQSGNVDYLKKLGYLGQNILNSSSLPYIDSSAGKDDGTLFMDPSIFSAYRSYLNELESQIRLEKSTTSGRTSKNGTDAENPDSVNNHSSIIISNNNYYNRFSRQFPDPLGLSDSSLKTPRSSSRHSNFRNNSGDRDNRVPSNNQLNVNTSTLHNNNLVSGGNANPANNTQSGNSANVSSDSLNSLNSINLFGNLSHLENISRLTGIGQPTPFPLGSQHRGESNDAEFSKLRILSLDTLNSQSAESDYMFNLNNMSDTYNNTNITDNSTMDTSSQSAETIENLSSRGGIILNEQLQRMRDAANFSSANSHTNSINTVGLSSHTAPHSSILKTSDLDSEMIVKFNSSSVDEIGPLSKVLDSDDSDDGESQSVSFVDNPPTLYPSSDIKDTQVPSSSNISVEMVIQSSREETAGVDQPPSSIVLNSTTMNVTSNTHKRSFSQISFDSSSGQDNSSSEYSSFPNDSVNLSDTPSSNLPVLSNVQPGISVGSSNSHVTPMRQIVHARSSIHSSTRSMRVPSLYSSSPSSHINSSTEGAQHSNSVPTAKGKSSLNSNSNGDNASVMDVGPGGPIGIGGIQSPAPIRAALVAPQPIFTPDIHHSSSLSTPTSVGPFRNISDSTVVPQDNISNQAHLSGSAPLSAFAPNFYPNISTRDPRLLSSYIPMAPTASYSSGETPLGANRPTTPSSAPPSQQRQQQQLIPETARRTSTAPSDPALSFFSPSSTLSVGLSSLRLFSPSVDGLITNRHAPYPLSNSNSPAVAFSTSLGVGNTANPFSHTLPHDSKVIYPQIRNISHIMNSPNSPSPIKRSFHPSVDFAHVRTNVKSDDSPQPIPDSANDTDGDTSTAGTNIASNIAASQDSSEFHSPGSAHKKRRYKKH